MPAAADGAFTQRHRSGPGMPGRPARPAPRWDRKQASQEKPLFHAQPRGGHRRCRDRNDVHANSTPQRAATYLNRRGSVKSLRLEGGDERRREVGLVERLEDALAVRGHDYRVPARHRGRFVDLDRVEQNSGAEPGRGATPGTDQISRTGYNERVRRVSKGVSSLGVRTHCGTLRR